MKTAASNRGFTCVVLASMAAFVLPACFDERHDRVGDEAHAIVPEHPCDPGGAGGAEPFPRPQSITNDCPPDDGAGGNDGGGGQGGDGAGGNDGGGGQGGDGAGGNDGGGGQGGDGGDDAGADLPYDVKLQIGDTFQLTDAFLEKGPLPASVLAVEMSDSSWRLSELEANEAFTVEQADCDHVGNRGVGRDRIFVTWRNPDGSTETDHLDLRYCE